MKSWFREMWPDCKQFLKLSGVVYGLTWAMLVVVAVFDGGISFWIAALNVGILMLMAASASTFGFLLSTIPYPK